MAFDQALKSLSLLGYPAIVSLWGGWVNARETARSGQYHSATFLVAEVELNVVDGKLKFFVLPPSSFRWCHWVFSLSRGHKGKKNEATVGPRFGTAPAVALVFRMRPIFDDLQVVQDIGRRSAPCIRR